MILKKTKICQFVFALLSGLAVIGPAYPVMPVLDWSNLLESIQQTRQQIAQTKTQLGQYETMLKNAKSLDAFHWDQARATMDNLVSSIDTLSYYKQQAGSLDAYLSQYQNTDYYRASPCFNGNCTQEERQALRNREARASEAQKRANDAMLRGIEQQQASLKADAIRLETLQKQAEGKGAEGQLSAILAANQLASAETHQLIQIRGLMVAEQNAAATRAAAIANKEAIQAAGDERFRSGSFKKSQTKTW